MATIEQTTDELAPVLRQILGPDAGA